MLTVKSITGKTIRLTDERWLHIVEGHPEMAGHLNDVLFAIASPIKILKGNEDELLAVVFEHAGKVDKLLKRIVLWQK